MLMPRSDILCIFSFNKYLSIYLDVDISNLHYRIELMRPTYSNIVRDHTWQNVDPNIRSSIRTLSPAVPPSSHSRLCRVCVTCQLTDAHTYIISTPAYHTPQATCHVCDTNRAAERVPSMPRMRKKNITTKSACGPERSLGLLAWRRKIVSFSFFPLGSSICIHILTYVSVSKFNAKIIGGSRNKVK